MTKHFKYKGKPQFCFRCVQWIVTIKKANFFFVIIVHKILNINPKKAFTDFFETQKAFLLKLEVIKIDYLLQRFEAKLKKWELFPHKKKTRKEMKSYGIWNVSKRNSSKVMLTLKQKNKIIYESFDKKSNIRYIIFVTSCPAQTKNEKSNAKRLKMKNGIVTHLSTLWPTLWQWR